MADIRSIPNVVALVGAEVATALLTHAGGLGQLAAMPSGTLRHLGRDDVTLTGDAEGNRNRALHAGVLLGAPVLADLATTEHRKRALEKLAGRCHLAAVVDSGRSKADGSYGRELLEEMTAVCAKLSAPVAQRAVKPLPLPKTREELKKSNRGGEKVRRIEEKYYGKSVAERKAEVVKFGVSVEQQKEDLMLSRDVRAAAAEEERRRVAKAASQGPADRNTKRPREDDDLLALRL